MGHRIDDLGLVNDPNRLIGILPARHVGSPEHNSSSWSWAKFHGRMDETHPKTIQESPENCRPCLAKVPRSSLWPFWIQQTALQLCHASRTSDLRAGHRTCFTIKNDFKSTLGCIVIICSWPGLGYLRSSYMYMLHGTTQEPPEPRPEPPEAVPVDSLPATGPGQGKGGWARDGPLVPQT